MATVGREKTNLKSIKKRLVWHYCLIVFLTVLVLEGLFITAVRQYYYGTAEQLLIEKATVSAAFYNKYLPNSQSYNLKDKANYILENIEKEELARVEVIDTQGNYIVNSHGFSPTGKVETSDFQAALEGEIGVWNGKNEVTGERIMAVTSPLKSGNKIIGVLRYVASMEATHHMVMQITIVALALGLLVIILTLSLSLLLARGIIIPIQEVTTAAAQMARGNFFVTAAKRDDDEIGKLADTLNYMAKEIMQSDQVKNDFISSISHELRTPLTSIKGWGETLLSGELQDQKETKEGLEIICKETNRMIGLVEELLEFSRFQSGQIRVQLEKLNINCVVEEVTQQFVIRAREKNIQLLVNLDTEPAEANGDCNRLKQVMINLLDNAIKFTPPNGIIQVSTKQDLDTVNIDVSDSGAGITSDDLPRVTEKFYKGDVKLPGSGLGLSIVSEIVKLHQGKMNIESTLGQGTTVTVLLSKA